MRVASLDLGSNTLRFFIVDVFESEYKVVAWDVFLLRLGEVVGKYGLITKSVMEKIFKILSDLIFRIRNMAVDKIFLVATAACRQAENGLQFIRQIREFFDLDVAKIVSGEEEACLSKKGVLAFFFNKNYFLEKKSWLVDIGGGSTELVNLDPRSKLVHSFKVGALVFSREYAFEKIVDESRTKKLRERINTLFSSSVNTFSKINCKSLLVTAGTACALASLKLSMRIYNPEEVNNLIVSKVELTRIYNFLSGVTLVQRRKILNLDPDRADVIIVGLIIMLELLDFLNVKMLTIIDAGLLEGIVFENIPFKNMEFKSESVR